MIDRSYDIIFEDLFIEILQNTHPKDVRKTIETSFLEKAKKYYIKLYEPYVKASNMGDSYSYKYLTKDGNDYVYKPFIYSLIAKKKYEYHLHRNLHAEAEFQNLINCIDEEILRKHYIVVKEKEDIALFHVNPNRKTPILKSNVNDKLYELSFVIALSRIGLSEIYNFLKAQLQINFDGDAEQFNAYLTGLQNIYFPKLPSEDSNKLNPIIKYFIQRTDNVKNNQQSSTLRKYLSNPDILTILYELQFFTTEETIRTIEIEKLIKLVNQYHPVDKRTLERYIRSIKSNDRKSPYQRKNSPKLIGKIKTNLDLELLKPLLEKEKLAGMTKEEYRSFWNHIEQNL